MDKDTIIKNLEALANGCDPVSGEIFSEDSPYSQPQIIRTLFHAVTALKNSNDAATSGRVKLTKEAKQQLNREKGLPFNYGLGWMMCQHFLGHTIMMWLH